MSDDFTKKINEMLEEHKDLFENLAKQEEIDKLTYNNQINQKERDALYYLLSNREEIKAEVDSVHNSGYKLFPPRLLDIYVYNFKENALKILNKHVEQFNLTPEEIFDIISEKTINNILGKEFLCPPKESDINK